MLFLWRFIWLSFVYIRKPGIWTDVCKLTQKYAIWGSCILHKHTGNATLFSDDFEYASVVDSVYLYILQFFAFFDCWHFIDKTQVLTIQQIQQLNVGIQILHNPNIFTCLLKHPSPYTLNQNHKLQFKCQYNVHKTTNTLLLFNVDFNYGYLIRQSTAPATTSPHWVGTPY